MTQHVQPTAEKAKTAPQKRLVLDQYGSTYECTELLGEGGQGKVWKTNHHNTLVKTFYRKNKDKEQNWFQHVQWVLRQDLEGLAIAAPKALITSPLPGYVMELMDGLHPLSTDMERSFTSLVEGRGLTGYLLTGGLKRRLLLLAEIANTLARLHAKGLAYGDLSPSNIYVSQQVTHSRAWLIDCDNICANERTGWAHLYSPGYGAPEVVRGESGVNSLTDAWSFAVIAYQMLTLNHPLKGILVEDGELELEQQAYRGELPWALEPDDDTNEHSGGIPLDLVASNKMQELFHRCFEQGKCCAWERPTLSEWRCVLDEAISMLLVCHNPACESSYYRSHACPFCKTATDANNSVLLTALVYSSDPELTEKLLKTGFGRVLNRGETAALKRMPAGTSLFYESDEVCQIRLDEQGLSVNVIPGNRIILVRNGKQEEITRRLLLSDSKKMGENYFLHLVQPQQSDGVTIHPVWAFRW
ncbi:protein kinase [Shewanella indica]|uniref:serine/threonine protein kinase n=1 Tax=Shewanella indica TaxID=768528 RepID=UPI0012FEC9F1|nr:serine/threonine-protein kinase [Shewanella indica]GHB02470.1 hypothetical protein GCM10007107_14250 [Shewanella indica]